MFGAPRPAGRIEKSRCARLARLGLADAGDDRPADHVRALAERAEADLRGIEAERAREVGLEGGELAAVARLGVELLLEAAGLARARHVGMREEALLDRRGGLGLLGRHVAAAILGLGGVGRVELAAGRRGRGGRRVGLVGGESTRAAVGRGRGVGLRHRVYLRDLPEVRVRVAVSVDVLEHDVAAELLALVDLLDDAVVHGHDRRALLGEDVDAAARVARLDEVGGVLALLHLLEQLLLRDVIRVTRACEYGEAALGQPGERADHVRRHAGDQARAEEDRVDVPVSVVVGVDRAADVLLVPGRLEVAGGGEDRVDRVVRILAPVLVGVDPVHLPGGGHELHPPERARGGHVEVAAVVGLDLVDRREDLPADPVLDARGLVDGEQEGRHAELADDEVGHAGGGRGAGEHVGEARVRRGRSSVGVAERRAATAALGLRDLTLGSSLYVAAEVATLARLVLDALAGARALLLGSAAGARALTATRSGSRGGRGRRLWRARNGGRGGHRLGRRGDHGAGKLDVVERRARGHVDGDRHDLAAGELHVHGLRLSKRREGQRGESGRGKEACNKQERENALLHPCSSWPSLGVLQTAALLGARGIATCSGMNAT